MSYEYEGNTLARQLAIAEHTGRKKKEKRLRNAGIALTLLFPAGGAGAYAMQNPALESIPTAITGTPTTEAPKTTLAPPVTVFERLKSQEKPTTTTLRKPASPTTTIASEAKPSFDEIYRAAGTRLAIPPEILYGLHRVESDCAGDGKIMNRQGSGARGPMQFMPGTWEKYGIDGDGDGDTDIDSVVDSIYGAANYLAHMKGPIESRLRKYGTNVPAVLQAAKSAGVK